MLQESPGDTQCADCGVDFQAVYCAKLTELGLEMSLLEKSHAWCAAGPELDPWYHTQENHTELPNIV